MQDSTWTHTTPRFKVVTKLAGKNAKIYRLACSIKLQTNLYQEKVRKKKRKKRHEQSKRKENELKQNCQNAGDRSHLCNTLTWQIPCLSCKVEGRSEEYALSLAYSSWTIFHTF